MNKKQPESAEYPFGRKEGVDLEFKEAANALPKNLFETICAFLNMDGGLIVLGVADDGTVTGVAHEAVDRMVAEIASLSTIPPSWNHLGFCFHRRWRSMNGGSSRFRFPPVPTSIKPQGMFISEARTGITGFLA